MSDQQQHWQREYKPATGTVTMRVVVRVGEIGDFVKGLQDWINEYGPDGPIERYDITAAFPDKAPSE